MKRLEDTFPYLDNYVRVVCTNGDEFSGLYDLYESSLDLEDDEPEVISLRYKGIKGLLDKGYYIDIPVQKIESIEIVPEDLDDLDDDF